MRCLVTYLRAEEVNEELFSNVETVSNYTECTDMVTSFFDALYNRFNSSQRLYDCVKTGVNSSGLKNAYILTEAVERLDLGWRKWKIPEKNKKIKEWYKIFHSGLKVVQETCHESAAKEDLAAEFDRCVKVKKIFPDFQEFCVKKHLLHLGILHSNDFDSFFRANSTSNDVKNCDPVLSKLRNEYDRELEQHFSDCTVNFYRQHHFQEYYLKVEYVLAQADLSQREMSFERDKFVQTLFAIMKNARAKCNV